MSDHKTKKICEGESIEMSISKADTKTAIGYWLSKKVFQTEIKISLIQFHNNKFTITFNREEV